MGKVDCTHPSGGAVNGYWVCGDCWSKLPERPRTYRMVRMVAYAGTAGDAAYRQEVVYAPVAEYQGVTLAAFIDMMARRLVAQTRGGFQMADARDYAVECLRGFGEPFGSSDMAWDEGGAWDIVDEDMSYWDEDSRDTNG